MAAIHSGHRRLLFFRVLVVVFAIVYAVLLALGGGLLGPAWDAGGSAYIHRVHHVGAVLFIALLVIGLLVQLRAPERRVAAFQQALLAIGALIIANLVIGDPDNHGGNVGIIDPVVLILALPILALLALHPARREVLRLRIELKPASTALAILGALPLILYAFDQAMTQRNSWPPAADPHHNGHWMIMAVLGFAIALIGLHAALSVDSRLPAWSSGLAAIGFGLASALLPDHASSAGTVWGAVSIGLGLLFIATTHLEARRSALRSLGRSGRLKEREPLT